MPRIGEDFLGSAIYLYRNRVEAKDNSSFGGSGFLVGYIDMHTKVVHFYAVTNAHVINDGFPIIRINKRFGEPDILDITTDAWIPHPEGDDLSICPLELTPHYDFKFVMIDGCVDKEKVSRFNIGVGDDVFMVGRFTGHPGTQKNLPIARFGNIAMVPSEQIRNGLGVKRPHYLVEVRSVSGFSGSPVFIYDAPIPPSLEHVRLERFPNLLLGVDCGHLPEHEAVLSAGIAAVVPAWCLLELLESPNVKALREMREVKIKSETQKE